MMIQNSKIIRRSIANTERRMFEKPARGNRRDNSNQSISQESLDQVLKSHNADMCAAIATGSAEWAGWYARQAVTYYLCFRASAIAAEKRRIFRTAYRIARREIFTVEVSPNSSGKICSLNRA
jgi:hypothetical protein